MEHRLRIATFENVLVSANDNGERYLFFYDDESTATLLKTLGRYAADKTLRFTWYDAAVLSQKARKLRRESDQECEDAAVRM